jgi:hypothetical protein
MLTMQAFHLNLSAVRQIEQVASGYTSLLARLTNLSLDQAQKLQMDWGWWS